MYMSLSLNTIVHVKLFKTERLNYHVSFHTTSYLCPLGQTYTNMYNDLQTKAISKKPGTCWPVASACLVLISVWFSDGKTSTCFTVWLFPTQLWVIFNLTTYWVIFSMEGIHVTPSWLNLLKTYSTLCCNTK